ncbi:MAG: glycosyltransferase family 9 protein [Phycisphaeraceae bacterium]
MHDVGHGHPHACARPGPARVLIVRPSALGDVARTVPALATIHHHWPAAEIDWLVNRAFTDVIVAHPALHRVVAFDRARLAGFGLRPAATRAGLALRRTLREGRYDVVFDLQGLARSGLLTRLTGAPRRVGFVDARELGWLGCNVRHRVEGWTHTVDRMLGLLAGEGMQPVYDMRLHVPESGRAWLADWMAEHGLEAGAYACVAPTARWLCKCWPAAKYAALIERLLASGQAGGGGGVVMLAAPGERAQVEAVLGRLPAAARRCVVWPTTNVGQMMAVLSGARLLVCNDSAPLHVAVGLGRPVVAVFGPTNPAEVGPYGRARAVVQPAGLAGAWRGGGARGYRWRANDQRLIDQVTLEQVWERVERETGCGGAERPKP